MNLPCCPTRIRVRRDYERLVEQQQAVMFFSSLRFVPQGGVTKARPISARYMHQKEIDHY